MTVPFLIILMMGSALKLSVQKGHQLHGENPIRKAIFLVI